MSPCLAGTRCRRAQAIAGLFLLVLGGPPVAAGQPEEPDPASAVQPDDAGVAPGLLDLPTAGEEEPLRSAAPRPPADPRLRPSPLVAQFWVAIAVIGAGLVAAVGLL